MHAIKESRLTYLQQVVLLPAETQRILTIAKQETQATQLIIAWRLIIMSLIITNRYCYHIHAFIISNWTLTGLCMTALCPCVRLSLFLRMLTMASALCSQVLSDTLIHTCHQTCIEPFIRLWGGRGHSAHMLTKSESASNQDCQLHGAKEALC